jgi:hypothetical protein
MRNGRLCEPWLAQRAIPASVVPQASQWCPERNGYRSSLFEETERWMRCGGNRR